MEGHDVAVTQDRPQLDPGRPGLPLEVRFGRAARIQELHPEPGGAPAHRLADATGPEDPQRLAAQLHAE